MAKSSGNLTLRLKGNMLSQLQILSFLLLLLLLLIHRHRNLKRMTSINFDIETERTTSNKIPHLFHYANAFISLLDSSILTLPYNYNMIGPIPAMILTIVVPLLLLSAVEKILKLIEKFKIENPRLEVLFGKVAGKTVKKLVMVMILVSVVSAFVANIIFLTESTENLFCGNPNSAFCLDRNISFSIIFFVYFFIGVIPSITKFGFISITGAVITLLTSRLTSSNTHSRLPSIHIR